MSIRAAEEDVPVVVRTHDLLAGQASTCEGNKDVLSIKINKEKS